VAGSRDPQVMQKVASAKWPSVMHVVQMRVIAGLRNRSALISAVTIPVGTAKVPQPNSIIIDAISRPKSVLGVMSPNPTVVIVVMAQ
jgi:hypothetical protein